MLNKELLYSALGAAIGSIGEEVLEEVFPGIGELGWTGEISGTIIGFLKGSSDETQESMQKFFNYLYRHINKDKLANKLDENEVKVFTEQFKNIPQKEKERILNNFKVAAPYEYEMIKNFLEDLRDNNNLQGATT
jgi:hypothetical protein